MNSFSRPIPGQRRGATLARALALAALAVVVSLASVGCNDANESGSPAPAPVSVRVIVVDTVSAARTVEAVGSLRGAREAVLSAKVTGTVIEIRKHAGESVERGEVLVVLDDREVVGHIGQAEGALAQATAAAALAESNLRRFEQLFARGAAAQLELDQARFAHETAQGAVRQAQAGRETADSYRSYARIPAPFDGQVVDRLVEVGDLAAPGRTLMKIEDARRLRLYVSLAETETGAAQPGVNVEIVVPSLGARTYVGKVAEVVPAVDPATRTMLVKIDMPEDRALRSGLFARARFASGTRQVVQVPRGAIVRRGGMTGVFIADAGHASFRLLEVVDDGHSPYVEVLAGLDAGARVVLDPPATLGGGAAIEVQP